MQFMGAPTWSWIGLKRFWCAVELQTTVLPFILRGVRLIGVNSATTPMALRRRVWARLATDLKPRHLDHIAYTIGLGALPGQFEKLLRGEARGRAVVALGPRSCASGT